MLHFFNCVIVGYINWLRLILKNTLNWLTYRNCDQFDFYRLKKNIFQVFTIFVFLSENSAKNRKNRTSAVIDTIKCSEITFF